MAEDEISVNFQAKNPSGIKLLSRLYDSHLVLNDLGVRLDDQLSKGEDEEITVPNQEDIQNLSRTFEKTVDIFTEIVNKYQDVDNFADNFAGTTKDFAEKLLTEMADFNNGVAEIADTEGGLAAVDDDKLNDWINKIMGEIVETNESFSKLVEESKEK